MLDNTTLLYKYVHKVYVENQKVFLDEDVFTEDQIAALKELANQIIPKDWMEGPKSKILFGNGWKVSFKEPGQFTVSDSTQEETALCIDEEWHILRGDHRLAFEGDPLRTPNEMKAIFDSLAPQYEYREFG
ncbi:TPA: hypothetical protein NKZ51_004535 [Vibrio parahaemolyticus]|nr:hypothetical protein [Vibrio parahaemolyticus]